MKRLHLLTVLTVVSVMLFSTSLFAHKPVKKTNAKNLAAIEENLLAGLASENYGLRVSTAYFLGEFKTSKSVIPLMNMLHTEKEECGRILAALALIKIGDSRGVYAVKQAGTYDESPRVKRLCKIFYNAYLHNEVNY